MADNVKEKRLNFLNNPKYQQLYAPKDSRTPLREYEPLYSGSNTVTDAAQPAEDPRAKYPVTQVYDANTDYMAIMQQAANQGDWLKAANAEAQRNSKITGEGLDPSLYTDYYSQYLPQNRYVYDPNKNEAYTAAKAQQDAIFEKIMNRGDFNYSLEDDPLYQQYRDQYTTLGKNAMRDTMGQASALTGGYGSTYAQQAGQQSYESYLARLNDIAPELYNAAYNRYQDEGAALLNRYNLAAGQTQDIYNQDYNAWSTRLGLEREDEANAYNRRLNEEQTAYERQLAAQQMQYQQTQDARSYLLTLISSTGYTPTDAELAAAGMTREQANGLKAAYEQALAAASFSSGGGSGRSSGGSGRRSSGGSGGGNVTPQTSTATPQKTQEQTIADQCSLSLANMKKYGGSKQEMRRELQRWVSQGLSQSEANRLAKLYGLDQDDTPAKSSSGGGKGGARGGGNTYTRGEY